MSEREWNILLKKHINEGCNLKTLCANHEPPLCYSTGKNYKKRYLEKNQQTALVNSTLPPINMQMAISPPHNRQQERLIPIISPTPTQGVFKKPAMGRGDAFTSDMRNEMHSILFDRDVGRSKGGSMTVDESAAAMTTVRQQYASNNIAIPKEYIQKTTSRILKEVSGSKPIKKPDVMSDRREEALHDFANAASLVAIFEAVIDSTVEKPCGVEFSAECFACIDATTSMIGGDASNPVIATVQGKAELRKRHKGVYRIRSKEVEGQPRTVKSHFVTTPSSEKPLVSAIHCIKDRNIKKMEWLNYSNSNGYASYVVAYPARLSKEQLRRLGNTSNERVPQTEAEELDAIVEEGLEDHEAVEIDMADPIPGGQSLTDLQIMTEILDKIVIPELIKQKTAERDEKRRLDPTIPENEPIGKMVLMLDGDHPQIEAILGTIIEKHNCSVVQFVKFPGGCSLTFQPSDVMKSHALLKGSIKHLDSKEQVQKASNPTFLKAIVDFLKRVGVSGKSLVTFANFFRVIMIYESRAFQAATVQNGWSIPGIWPYDRVKMLSTCQAFRDASQQEAEAIMAAIPILVDKAKVSGICEETDLQEHIYSIGSSFKSPIDNMGQRCINQQRALWLNKQGVLDRRNADRERKEADAAVAKLKADAAITNKNRQKMIQEAKLANIDEALQGPPPVGTWCSGNCSKDKTKSTEPGDDWKGCNGLATCGIWFCANKGCQTSLSKHRIRCCARNLVDQTNTEI